MLLLMLCSTPVRPQRARRSAVFDSTLGFPGEGPGAAGEEQPPVHPPAPSTPLRADASPFVPGSMPMSMPTSMAESGEPTWSQPPLESQLEDIMIEAVMAEAGQIVPTPASADACMPQALVVHPAAE